jgi:hypothetical protein
MEERAAAGDKEAQYDVGYCYDHALGVERNFAKTVEWYIKAAALGHAEAQFTLAWFYLKGADGIVRQNHEKALDLYRRAAQQGHSTARYNIGYFYQEGMCGFAKDLKTAAEHYETAAALGFANAQFNLGSFYKNGIGVEQNIEKSIKYLKAAAKQDHDKAKRYLRYLSQMKKKWSRIEDLIKAADSGNAEAECDLGLFYSKHGHGTTEGLIKAVPWLIKAADKGFAEAQFWLAYLYESGIGVEEDIDKAIELYGKAAAQGHKDAKADYKRLRYNYMSDGIVTVGFGRDKT